MFRRKRAIGKRGAKRYKKGSENVAAAASPPARHYSRKEMKVLGFLANIFFALRSWS